MNGSYYQNPVYINEIENKRDEYNEVSFPLEQSYVENILRRNKGKRARIHASYPDSVEWRDKVFEGIIDEAGRDNLIIRNPETGVNYLILMVYVNYVEFDEKIIYGK